MWMKKPNSFNFDCMPPVDELVWHRKIGKVTELRQDWVSFSVATACDKDILKTTGDKLLPGVKGRVEIGNCCYSCLNSTKIHTS